MAMNKTLPTRGDVALRECTRDPIFLLQSRAWRINAAEGLPSAVVWDASQCDFRYTDPANPEEPFLSMATLAEEFPDNVFETWRTESVWFTREAAERYGRARSYNYREGWRVYCVCAEGDLAAILRAHSERPTGDLEPK